MFTISTNLEYMFKEAGERIEDRIAAAAAAGITHVEIFSLEGRDIDSVAEALKTHNVTLHSMLVDPRIMLVLKDTHEKFLATLKDTAEQAVKLGCKHLVCGSGTGAPFLPRAISLDVVCEAIDKAADIAEEMGLTLLLEAVNTRVDHPGVFFSHTSDTYYIANKLNRPSVKLLYDLYHSVAEHENVADTLTTIKDHIGHIQLADYPGRGEPGAGTLDWPTLLGQISDTGYTGPLGVECYPSGESTPEALTYIRSLAN
ncbi:MAG: TIM barrel protein [Gammaproteobacteria bacterium]|nr:TIM barrel protein [Gammaproteobacteria bacterium]